jgi:hypothetical protein
MTDRVNIHVFSRALIAFPLLWLGSMYVCWIAATQTLGRRPRPMFDDPTGIEAGWRWFYDLSWSFHSPGIPMFLVTAVGLAASFLFQRLGSWRLGLVEIGIAVALMVFVIFSAQWFDFAYWYFDL